MVIFKPDNDIKIDCHAYTMIIQRYIWSERKLILRLWRAREKADKPVHLNQDSKYQAYICFVFMALQWLYYLDRKTVPKWIVSHAI